MEKSAPTTSQWVLPADEREAEAQHEQSVCSRLCHGRSTAHRARWPVVVRPVDGLEQLGLGQAQHARGGRSPAASGASADQRRVGRWLAGVVRR